MKKTVATITIIAASLCGAATKYGPHNPMATDCATILITDCKYDTRGIDVEFETSLPPPYVVGVFDISVMQFCGRFNPLHSIVTTNKLARLDGDFCSYCNSFVQVFTPDITNSLVFTNQRLVTTVTTNKFVYHYGPAGEKIVDELETKVKKEFVKFEDEIKFKPTMTEDERREASGGKFDFKLDVTSPLRDGYFCEAWGMGEAFLEGRSNMWPIKRMFSPLSSSDGKMVALDWFGYIGFTPAPKTTPNNVLVPGGIKIQK